MFVCLFLQCYLFWSSGYFIIEVNFFHGNALRISNVGSNVVSLQHKFYRKLHICTVMVGNFPWGLSCFRCDTYPFFSSKTSDRWYIYGERRNSDLEAHVHSLWILILISSQQARRCRKVPRWLPSVVGDFKKYNLHQGALAVWYQYWIKLWYHIQS